MSEFYESRVKQLEHYAKEEVNCEGRVKQLNANITKQVDDIKVRIMAKSNSEDEEATKLDEERETGNGKKNMIFIEIQSDEINVTISPKATESSYRSFDLPVFISCVNLSSHCQDSSKANNLW